MSISIIAGLGLLTIIFIGTIWVSILYILNQKGEIKMNSFDKKTGTLMIGAYESEISGRYYVTLKDGYRLIYENGQYVGRYDPNLDRVI